MPPITIHQGTARAQAGTSHTETHSWGATTDIQISLQCMDRLTERKADRQTDGHAHTSSGLTEDIRQIKGHGPVGSSQEVDHAKEYSSHVEQEQ